MEQILSEICGYINNYFVKDVYRGIFKIENGNINIQDWDDAERYSIFIPQRTIKLVEGQYYRIRRSALNDGIYKYSESETELMDEEFDGELVTMAIPVDVLNIAREIEEWLSKYGGANGVINSPLQSESFQNYSYTKKSGYGNDGKDGGITWQSMFGNRLLRYKKI